MVSAKPTFFEDIDRDGLGRYKNQSNDYWFYRYENKIRFSYRNSWDSHLQEKLINYLKQDPTILKFET